MKSSATIVGLAREDLGGNIMPPQGGAEQETDAGHREGQHANTQRRKSSHARDMEFSDT